jgi:murein DD-endopeptidase MepM/ murein hydrolase activator NlpD
MKKFLFSVIAFPIFILLLLDFVTPDSQEETPVKAENPNYRITGVVKPNESLESIFGKHNLDKTDLALINKSTKKLFNLSKISVGDVYLFELDKKENNIQSMQYGIDDMSYLTIVRASDRFKAEKINFITDKKIGSFHISIEDNLMNSMPDTHREYYRLALKLSDIYAWDIDFSRDIRNGDTVKVIVEELWVGEAFKGYGDILAAEIINNGKTHTAYRFKSNDYTDYYDAKGKSLRKALLKSPLKFKYISSRFSKRRLHPKLRVYRPHLGVDYAAPSGTPVSASGSGTIRFAGYKGQNGRMVRIKHNGGYETYYGHLSRIPKKVRKGKKISQGDIIGYVGSTGLATGPHLDYRVKFNGRFVDPLKIKLPRGKAIPKNLMASFMEVADKFNSSLTSLIQPVVASKDRRNKSG